MQAVVTTVSREKALDYTPEKIAARKIIIYKTLIDPTVIKLATEKVKDRLFVKFGFLKPNPDQIFQKPRKCPDSAVVKHTTLSRW